jgi:hypothetical protein
MAEQAPKTEITSKLSSFCKHGDEGGVHERTEHFSVNRDD